MNAAGNQTTIRLRMHNGRLVALAAALSGLAAAGCGADLANPSASVERSVAATPTPATASRTALAGERPDIDQGAPRVSIGEVPAHLGQLVNIQGRVRWCRTLPHTPAIYALDTTGTIRFEIAPEHQAAFTPGELSAYCGTVRLHGRVRRVEAIYVIGVTSPDQLTIVGRQ